MYPPPLITAPDVALSNLCSDVSDEVPTLIVIEVFVVSVIVTGTSYAASGVPAFAPVPLARGYDLAVLKLSKPHLNDIELAANLIFVPTLRSCLPISSVITPVDGVYSPSVGVNVTSGEVPTSRSNVFVVTFSSCTYLPAIGSLERGYCLVAVLLSIVQVNDNAFSSSFT